MQDDLPAALAALSSSLRLLEKLDETLGHHVFAEAFGLLGLDFVWLFVGTGVFPGALGQAVDLGEPMDKITPEIFTHLILNR